MDDQKWCGCLEEKITGSGAKKRSRPPKSNGQVGIANGMN
jgi:hypothetical protein